MPTAKDLAIGLEKAFTKSEKDKIKSVLISSGRAAACRITCNLINARTGLPKEACEPICGKITTKLAKEIRGRLSRST